MSRLLFMKIRRLQYTIKFNVNAVCKYLDPVSGKTVTAKRHHFRSDKNMVTVLR